MCANILKRSGNASKNPGVAKFGIALEWGSRGLEFESRHSDQKTGMSNSSFLFFILVLARELEASCITISGLRQLARSAKLPRVRISTLGPNKVDSSNTIGIETINSILFLKNMNYKGFSALCKIGLVSL